MIFKSSSKKEESTHQPNDVKPPWKVLIVDDDEGIHHLTKMVLRDLEFNQRHISFVSAYSGQEAMELIEKHPDTALIFLDVIMETDSAGLDVVRFIRGKLKNTTVRIILRTGQAGIVPEQKIIKELDINDYKEKTELTAQKLTTAIISSFRTFEAMTAVKQMNETLEQKISLRTAELQTSNAKLEATVNELREGEHAGKLIQFKLLPKSDVSFGKIHFEHHILPSSYLSGDFIDYFQIDEQRIGFYIADVSGHGVASALVTILVKNYFTNALERYHRHEDKSILHPERILNLVNIDLLKADLDKYAAILYGVIDRKSHTWQFANSGIHPWPLMHSKDNTYFIECRSTPVGLFDFSDYESQTIDLPAEFTLTLFSDGILEVLQKEDINQMMDFIKHQMSKGVKNIAELEAGLGIKSEGERPDDLTILMVKGCI